MMPQTKKGQHMLTMEEALSLLRDGEKRHWLIADWSWNTDHGDNGGVYLGLVRTAKAASCLERPKWDVSKGDVLTGFSMWWEDGVKKTEYNYAPVAADSWPLVIYRDFHGLEEAQYDLLEEFRHFHNLWHDRKGDSYYKIKDDGDRQKVVFRDASGALLVDTAMLRKFCAARDLSIILQVDSVQFFDAAVPKTSEDFNEDDLVATSHKTNDTGLSGKPAFGRMLGKRIIRPLFKEQCGVWPYEESKSYESYIVGVNEDGSDATYTCDPESLDNYFGANPGHPHYLTPIYFRKEVLGKYLDRPSLFSVEDGYLRCGGLWGLPIDNDHEDRIVVFLGDLGRDLPESEQRYWRSFNVRPEGGVSASCFKRSFLCQFADPDNAELLVKPARRKLLRAWRKAFGFDLYTTFHHADRGILADLRLPLSDEWTEFDRCTIAAAKIFVDYLNEAEIEKGAAEAIKQLKVKDPDRPIRGIDKLAAWLDEHGGGTELIGCIESLRLVQALRSKSAAHRKSSALAKLLEGQRMGDASLKEVYKELILAPILTYCQALATFADSQNASD